MGGWNQIEAPELYTCVCGERLVRMPGVEYGKAAWDDTDKRPRLVCGGCRARIGVIVNGGEPRK